MEFGIAPDRCLRVDVVVTRHPGLLEALQRCGAFAETARIMSHVQPEDVEGKRVLGVLPLHLACLASSVTEAVLEVEPEMRGVSLNVDQTLARLRGFRTYCVIKQELPL